MDIVHKKGKTSLKGFCDHCGNLTFQSLLHYDAALGQDGGMYTYTFCKCTICNGIILAKHVGDWDAPLLPHYEKPKLTDIEFQQLWPPPLSLDHEAPDRVRKIYEEARLVKKHSPSAFVVQIARALEAVTNDRNAEGKNLYEKLNWLIAQGEIPKLFGEMGHLNRIIRNWGAHDTEIIIEPEDAEVADEFFKAIIEYLYVAPAKVRRVSELIEERKSS